MILLLSFPNLNTNSNCGNSYLLPSFSPSHQHIIILMYQSPITIYDDLSLAFLFFFLCFYVMRFWHSQHTIGHTAGRGLHFAGNDAKIKVKCCIYSPAWSSVVEVVVAIVHFNGISLLYGLILLACDGLEGAQVFLRFPFLICTSATNFWYWYRMLMIGVPVSVYFLRRHSLLLHSLWYSAQSNINSLQSTTTTKIKKFIRLQTQTVLETKQKETHSIWTWFEVGWIEWKNLNNCETSRCRA